MIKMFSRLGLAKKLTLTTVFMMACSQLFITALVYLSVTHFGESFLAQELLDRTRFIEMSLAEPLWNFDRTQLEKVGNSLLVDTEYIHLSGLKIVTPNNETLFEKGSKLEKIEFNAIGEKLFTKLKTSQFIAITNILEQFQLLLLIKVLWNQSEVT